jgi:CRP/FNR family transcriptional regulator, anaerobic regulatory protein
MCLATTSHNDPDYQLAEQQAYEMVRDRNGNHSGQGNEMVLLSERLAQRIALTDDELAFLQSLAGRRAKFRRRQIIQTAGDPAYEAFMLLSGWAITFSDFADGSRQVRRIHVPGDLLAMPSIAMQHHAESIEAVTEVVVAPFDRARLIELFERFPRLAAIIFILVQAERITYGDRLCSLSRLSCKARMAFMLLDVLNRLRACDSSITSSFHMHLTRGQMGDIAGMTAVHASRMWSKLISEGLIDCDDGFVTILDEDRLVSLSGYVNRDEDLDFSWVPSVNEAGAARVASLNLPPPQVLKRTLLSADS